MNKSEFQRAALRGAAAEIPKVAVQMAVEHIIEQRGEDGSFYARDISDAILLSGRMNSLLGEQRLTHVTVKGRDLIDSDVICEAFLPKVQEARRHFFGSEEVPFPGTAANPLTGLKTAFQWIEAASQIERPAGDHSKLRKLINEIRSMMLCDVTLNMSSVAFPGTSTQYVQRVPAPVGTPLYELASFVKDIAGDLFSEAATAVWILNGIKPVVPRVKIATTTTMQGPRGSAIPPRSSVTVTINASDLSWNELLDVYRSIRSQPSVKRQKVNPLHMQIRSLVTERGGPPKTHGGKEKFWKSVREELLRDRRFASRVPGSWNAIKKAYVELHKGESSNGSLGPTTKTRR